MTDNNPLAHTSLAILAAIPEALIFSDCEGIIRLWNPGAETALGFTAEEAIGQNLDIIIPAPMRKAHWDGYHHAIERGDTKHKNGSMITRAVRKDGQQIYIDVSFCIVKDDKGKVIGSAAIARDATERFLREKELRKQLATLSAQTS